MKIFSAAQIKDIDRITIEQQHITSYDLMERAAKAIAGYIKNTFGKDTPVIVFAGPGNNGGDALATARLLSDSGYQVTTYLFNPKGSLSPDCAANRDLLVKSKNAERFTEVTLNFDPPRLDRGTLVIDGLFGAGLDRPLEGGFAAVVKYINASEATVVSIDLPSGLMADDNTNTPTGIIIHADTTLTLQQKKLCMMLADCQPMLGRVVVLDIQLSAEAIAQTPSTITTTVSDAVQKLIPTRPAFAHKGTMGNALIAAGSYGMAGAAVLAAQACLRTGVGKVTVATPTCNRNILQIAVPEAVLSIDEDDRLFSQSVEAGNFDAVAIGPGLGTDEDTAIAVFEQIRQTSCPVVIDADALNILARHRAWIDQLPAGMILTPHPREFDRLTNASLSDFDRLSKARDLAERLRAYIILKGHHSALCMPDGTVVFNTTGNAGMATAGCGDVLTGIITALLARGLSRRDACILGMYLHGVAGDVAARYCGEESMVASDLIRHLPEAFRELRGPNFEDDK